MAKVTKKGKQEAKRSNYSQRNKGKYQNRSGKCDRQKLDGENANPIGENTVRTNNPAWYSPNAQLVKDVASFPYGLALGSKLHYGTSNTIRYMNDNSIPGIMRINFTPVMGWSESPSSPLNIVGKNLYTFIRSANSGARNYDYPDLMLYYIAMDSAYSYLSHMRRVYGLLGTTNYMNRYYPDAMITALGGDYSDLVANMADFRAYINMYALKLQSYVMPAHASYFARHDWMMNNVFSDTGLGKDQTYVFVPDGFFQFGLDSDKAGTCSLVTFDAAAESFGDTKWTGTFKQFKLYGDMLLDSIVGTPGAEDFNTISGDILKAYGDSGVVRANIISDDYSIVPIVDEEALAQIQNATAMGDVSVAFVQSTDKQYLISKPRAKMGLASDSDRVMANQKADLATADRFVNLYKDNPEPSDTLVATRLTVVPSVEVSKSDPYIYLNYEGCGSEIVTSFECYRFTHNTSSDKWILQSTGKYTSFPACYVRTSNSGNQADMDYTAIIGQIYEMYAQFAYLAAFRYHPYQIYSACGYSPLNESVVESVTTPIYYGDTSNYAMLDDDSLKAMHETALLAQLGFENYRTSSI